MHAVLCVCVVRVLMWGWECARRVVCVCCVFVCGGCACRVCVCCVWGGARHVCVSVCVVCVCVWGCVHAVCVCGRV